MPATEPRMEDGGAPTDEVTEPSDPDEAVATTEPRAETVAFESGGVRCEGDLYLPTTGEPPWPTVVLAHVFGAERAWGLAPFAERFAEAGLAAFVFDHRHLGTSGGTPRRLVDPDRQLDDWRAALAFVRALDEVDAERVALWGSSFSGGHVLATAARDPDVAAVVAQVPFVDGRATVAHQAGDRSSVQRLRDLGRAVADRILAVAGLGPIEIPFVSEPDGGGLVDSPGAAEGFTALVPEGVELVNRTPARVILDLMSFRPGRHAADVDVPVHVVVAGEDRLLPHGPTERVVDELDDPSVHRVGAAHFEVHYAPWFEAVVTEQVAFLTEVLGVNE